MNKMFKPHPELIAIHVPKTAGSTFYKVLKKSYGLGLERVKTPVDVGRWNNGLDYKSNNPFVKAIYGHIQAHPEWQKQYPDAKLITWLRDPVERVVSTYYHWASGKTAGGSRYEEFASKNLSLLEFVNSETYRAVVFGYATYLGRIESSAYSFVGRTECFEEDLVRLEDLLRRKLKFNGSRENTNQQKPEVDEGVKQQIRDVIASEYDLYHELLAQNDWSK